MESSARIAPNWMSTAKVLPKSSSSKPKNLCTSNRWPVEDTGMNSVSPSTIPRTNALNRSDNMNDAETEDQEGRQSENDTRLTGPSGPGIPGTLFPHRQRAGNEKGGQCTRRGDAWKILTNPLE